MTEMELYKAESLLTSRCKIGLKRVNQYLLVERGELVYISSQVSTVGGRSVTEMDRVVAAMRKVVERLQSENESLRKSAAKLRGTCVTQLEAENKKLKVCL